MVEGSLSGLVVFNPLRSQREHIPEGVRVGLWECRTGGPMPETAVESWAGPGGWSV